MNDKLVDAPFGHFRLWAWRAGVLVPELGMDERNLIVDGSKQTHARLLGGDTANRSITQIGFGTGSSAAATGNTALSSPYLKGLDSVAYPNANQVQFNFSLASGENNGMGIFEFGLLTPTNVLYARKVRASALPKDTDLSFTGSWTISF